MKRFEDKINKTSTCWLFTSPLDRRGYCKFWLDGRSQWVHRVSWAMYRGEIPVGMHILHKCDVGNCVNPEHLFLGTHADNMADMACKGRAARKLGVDHNMNKLQEWEVLSIRWLVKLGKDTQRDIAKMFNISEYTVSDIKLRKSWRHI